MSATTVKVEGELLRNLQRIKPETLSFSAFVRAVLEREVKRATDKDAARRYSDLVRETPEESEWLEEWEGAPLDRPRKRR